MNVLNELELKMAAKEAETEGIPGQSQYGEYVQTLCESLQEKKAAEGYLVDAQAAEDYATYIVTLGGNELQETDPNPFVTQLLSQAQDLRIKAKEKETRAASIEKDLKLLKGAGRISKALESTLQGTNVQQQQSYHSNSLIGNHINICLQVNNISKICKVVVQVTENHCPSLLETAKANSRIRTFKS
ncbi:uncharacterized protein [Acropora muricata]|uniref:uncharacterized protein isoform X2 n=1 Tax=Acropora muricata TaxID=159855 RepID=UPI0034E603B1